MTLGGENNVDDFMHKQRLKLPRGTDVSQQGNALTVASTATSVNLITANTAKILRCTGVNFVERANVDTIELIIDEGLDTVRTITFHRPPHPPNEFGRVKTFDPPLVALATIDLQVTDDGTPIADYQSLLNAFEADQ